MILTCPNCTTRFLLSAFVLAPDGRKVKCSNCEETWFQLPDPEELNAPEDQRPEEIPESVKPIPDGSSVPAIKDEDEPKKKGRFKGVFAALLFFILVSAAFVLGKVQIMEKFPQTLPVYSALGIVSSLPGEGLVFDRLRAEERKSGDETKIFLSGAIINLTDKDSQVPMMRAEVRDSKGNVLDQVMIAPPEKKLTAENTMPFEAILNDAETASEIRIQFTLN